MRKVILMLIAMLSMSVIQAQTTTFYIDFGPNDVTNGNETTSPDANGNYWNNMSNSTAGQFIALVDKDSVVSTIQSTLILSFGKNGINHGGLLSPSVGNLDELAIATATQDYFFLSSTTSGDVIEFSGLDPAKGYVFSMFGTRLTTATRITEYILTGTNADTVSLQTSGENIGSDGVYDGNDNTLAVTDTIFPDANGKILFDMNVVTGGFSYVGLMQIDEITIPIADDGITSHYIDFGLNTSNGDTTSSPDANGNYWNNFYVSTAGTNMTLVDEDNNASGIVATLIISFGQNGVTAGGLQSPSALLLSDLAVESATEDYFFVANTTPTNVIEFSGLDQSSRYIFTMFGTRNTTSTRISEYTLTGNNTSVKTLQTSGENIGSDGIYDGNDNTVAVSDTMTPDADGKIFFDLEVSAGGFAYIGAMKIDVIDASVIPVELLSLDIYLEETAVVLDWITASEEQNSHFDIERSIDGITFEEIGRVEGFGTTYTLNYYSFKDENPISGTAYYRIRQVDFDGSFTYTNILSIDVIKAFAQKVTLAPNPTRDFLNISLPPTWTNPTIIQVCDMTGRIIRTETTSNDQILSDFSNLESGQYLLRIINNQRVITKLVIKN